MRCSRALQNIQHAIVARPSQDSTIYHNLLAVTLIQLTCCSLSAGGYSIKDTLPEHIGYAGHIRGGLAVRQYASWRPPVPLAHPKSVKAVVSVHAISPRRLKRRCLVLEPRCQTFHMVEALLYSQNVTQ